MHFRLSERINNQNGDKAKLLQMRLVPSTWRLVTYVTFVDNRDAMLMEEKLDVVVVVVHVCPETTVVFILSRNMECSLELSGVKVTVWNLLRYVQCSRMISLAYPPPLRAPMINDYGRRV
jgi:hypothetical protein